MLFGFCDGSFSELSSDIPGLPELTPFEGITVAGFSQKFSNVRFQRNPRSCAISRMTHQTAMAQLSPSLPVFVSSPYLSFDQLDEYWRPLSGIWQPKSPSSHQPLRPSWRFPLRDDLVTPLLPPWKANTNSHSPSPWTSVAGTPA